MGLPKMFTKKPKTNSVGEKLDRLTPEGELPFGWMAYNKDIITKMEDEQAVFLQAINDAASKSAYHAALKSYLLYLEDGKKHYSKINECAGKYFEEYICDCALSDSIRKWFEESERKLKEKP